MPKGEWVAWLGEFYREAVPDWLAIVVFLIGAVFCLSGFFRWPKTSADAFVIWNPKRLVFGLFLVVISLDKLAT